MTAGLMRSVAAGLALLLSLGLGAAPASAQLADLEKIAHTTPQQRADFLTQRMKRHLSLDAEQVPKVHALNLEYAQKQQPLLEEKGRLLARVAKMRAINAEKEAALQKLLTAEQWRRYETDRAGAKQAMEDWAAKKAGS